MEQDELLDLVDPHDNIIGQAARTAVYAQNLNNFRVVNLFLQNDQGQLWIPRRSAQKRIFPLCLDVSMGGHVESGESYLDALLRETSEELNINLETAEYQLLGHLTPHQHHVSAFMQVYQLHSNTTPSYNPDDFIESYWLTPQEILNKIQQGDPAKDDLPKLIHHFYIPN